MTFKREGNLADLVDLLGLMICTQYISLMSVSLQLGSGDVVQWEVPDSNLTAASSVLTFILIRTSVGLLRQELIYGSRVASS